ncbi:MAG: arsenate reductase (glutaredoxin) [Woeseiaceae bacterium]
MLTIYHNPRCSKSRQTLEIITESGIEPAIVQYLENPPDAARILHMAGLLRIPVAALLRRGEDDFKNATDLPDLDDDAALANWIEQNPRVLERPIVVDDSGDRAIVGRPPENVRELID